MIQVGDTVHGPLSEKLSFLQELMEFDLGRFLIANGGFNGKWSHYAFFEFPFLESTANLHPLEVKILNSFPMSGSAERIRMVKEYLGRSLRPNSRVLSVPCGVMAELSSLNVDLLNSLSIVGVDLDDESLRLAREYAKKRDVLKNIELLKMDAWSLKFDRHFDFVLSLGLAPYSADLQTALKLYRSLYSVLNPKGTLIVAYLTPSSPDAMNEQDLSTISLEEIRFKNIIFNEILQMRQKHFNTSSEIVERLSSIGFSKVEILKSRLGISNIALATKSE